MHPDAEILITGYSDSEGYEKYNQKLSEFRANIVGSFLLGKGIKPDKIEIQGLGSQNPIESNATAAGRKMNRRVEIEVKKKPPAPETDNAS
jgi:general secretion pathway protein A